MLAVIQMSKRQIKWILGEMTVEAFKSQEQTRYRKEDLKQKSNWVLNRTTGATGVRPQDAGDGVVVRDGD